MPYQGAYLSTSTIVLPHLKYITLIFYLIRYLPIEKNNNARTQVCIHTYRFKTTILSYKLSKNVVVL